MEINHTDLLCYRYSWWRLAHSHRLPKIMWFFFFHQNVCRSFGDMALMIEVAMATMVTSWHINIDPIAIGSWVERIWNLMTIFGQRNWNHAIWGLASRNDCTSLPHMSLASQGYDESKIKWVKSQLCSDNYRNKDSSDFGLAHVKTISKDLCLIYVSLQHHAPPCKCSALTVSREHPSICLHPQN